MPSKPPAAEQDGEDEHIRYRGPEGAFFIQWVWGRKMQVLKEFTLAVEKGDGKS